MTDQQMKILLNVSNRLAVISSELSMWKDSIELLSDRIRELSSSLDSLITWLPAESKEHDN